MHLRISKEELHFRATTQFQIRSPNVRWKCIFRETHLLERERHGAPQLSLNAVYGHVQQNGLNLETRPQPLERPCQR